MKLLVAVILSLQFGTYWYYVHDNYSVLMLKLKRLLIQYMLFMHILKRKILYEIKYRFEARFSSIRLSYVIMPELSRPANF